MTRRYAHKRVNLTSMWKNFIKPEKWFSTSKNLEFCLKKMITAF